MTKIFQMLVILISLAMVVLSIACLIFPKKLVSSMNMLSSIPAIKYGDIFIRGILGVSLIFSATDSLYPVLFYVLGVASCLAALSLLVIDNNKIEIIVKVISKYVPTWGIRSVCGFGAGFFGFIIYATNISLL